MEIYKKAQAFFIDPLDKDIRSKLDTLRELGISKIATNGVNPSDKAAHERFAKLLEDYCMEIVSVHGVGAVVDVEGKDDVAIDRMMAEVDRALLWKSRNVVFHFRNAVDGKGWSDGTESTAYIQRVGLNAFDKQAERVLLPVCQYAYEKGVTVALENLAPMYIYSQDVGEMVRFIQSSSIQSLGICFDTGHCHLAGLNVSEQVEKCGSLLCMLHLHDNMGPQPPTYDIYSSDWHLAPGLGTINWVEFILTLNKINYSDPVLFETEKVPGLEFEEAVRWIIHFWDASESIANQLYTMETFGK